jgi:hypothetical protein
VWLNYANPSSFADANSKDYGGWDTTAQFVYTPYMWLANFPGMKFVAGDGKVSQNAEENEPAWPMTVAECDSRRAFVTHRISDTPGVALWDAGHLGKHFAGTSEQTALGIFHRAGSTDRIRGWQRESDPKGFDPSARQRRPIPGHHVFLLSSGKLKPVHFLPPLYCYPENFRRLLKFSRNHICLLFPVSCLLLVEVQPRREPAPHSLERRSFRKVRRARNANPPNVSVAAMSWITVSSHDSE